MKEKQTHNFLIRNIPIEVYHLLEKAAKDNHRSKNQQAIVALSNGLSEHSQPIKQPKPFKWKKKISSKFIKNAIQEGRE